MRKVLCSAFIAAAAISAAPAHAASGDVIFNGHILSTCLLVVVPTGGTLAASGDLTSLSSKNLLGLPGTVNITTTGGVSLSVDPTVVTNIRPEDDPGTINWVPSYSSLGIHNITETSDPTPLGLPGTSVVSVHLAGTKSGGGTFAGGHYQATVTVRCE